MRLLAFLRGALHHQSKIKPRRRRGMRHHQIHGGFPFLPPTTTRRLAVQARPQRTGITLNGGAALACLEPSNSLFVSPWAMTPRGHFSNVGREPTELFVFRRGLLFAVLFALTFI